MKLLFDLLPVVFFFAAYKFAGIYVATAVAIATALLQAGWMLFRNGKIPTMHWVTLGLLVLFGGMTLIFQDPLFIKWKPSVVNWLFGFAFLLAPLFGGKTLPQRAMGANIDLPQQQWKKLSYAWVVFFFAVGILNLAVAYNFSEETWVNFKLFGLMGLTFAFILAQGFYVSRFIQPVQEEQ